MLGFYKRRVERMEAICAALKAEIELLQAEIDSLADLAAKQEDALNDRLEAMENTDNSYRGLHDVLMGQMNERAQVYRQYRELSLRLDNILDI